MSVALTTNVVELIGFSAAFVFAAMLPAVPDGRVTPGIKAMLMGMMGIFVFVALSHVLQYANITIALDQYENYVKVMFFPLGACAIYALRVNDQLRDTQRHAMILGAEHDMLMRVVDTTPTGLIVLDGGGRIEFANDKAKALLELAEDSVTGTIATPEWVCDCDPSGLPGVMACAFDNGPLREATCSVSWPDGRVQHLLLNATPIITADGSSVGAVVAFAKADGENAAECSCSA